jgi:hypothetical protein
MVIEFWIITSKKTGGKKMQLFNCVSSPRDMKNGINCVSSPRDVKKNSLAAKLASLFSVPQ